MKHGKIMIQATIQAVGLVSAILGGWYAARLSIENEISDIKVQQASSISALQQSISGQAGDISDLKMEVNQTNQNVFLLTEHFGLQAIKQ